jgi:leucyl aminopeptidase
MVKCTGHYGTPDRISADFHIVFFIDDDGWFMKTAELFCPEGKGVLANLRANLNLGNGAADVFPFFTSERHFIFANIGKKEGISIEKLRRAAGKAARFASTFSASSIAVYCPTEDIQKRFIHDSFEHVVESLVEATLLSLYKFEKFLSKSVDDTKLEFSEIQFVTAEEGFQGKLKHGIEVATAIVEGVELARNLANAPSNELTAEALAKDAAALGKKFTMKTIILSRKEIESHKMGGLLAVNRGSVNEPRFIILEYNELKRKLPTYVLVGKGVTFDSGGVCIKPAANMDEMKMDMSGAATVLGVMHSVAKLKLPIHLIGLIPATDNMVGGKAYCPGDVIRISDGTSVEVINTDAEGRIVLADALVYAQRFKPAGIIDLATLTGACVVALGQCVTGMFGTGTDIKTKLKTAGEKTYERVWELPIYEEHEALLKSSIADVKNLGGKWGGAITAAAFLKRFTGDFPWVHLDIAGTAIVDEAGDYFPKGGTGVGVRLLTEFFRNLKAS